MALDYFWCKPEVGAILPRVTTQSGLISPRLVTRFKQISICFSRKRIIFHSGGGGGGGGGEAGGEWKIIVKII